MLGTVPLGLNLLSADALIFLLGLRALERPRMEKVAFGFFVQLLADLIPTPSVIMRAERRARNLKKVQIHRDSLSLILADGCRLHLLC